MDEAQEELAALTRDARYLGATRLEAAVAVVIIESQQRQAMPQRLLLSWMDVFGVAVVAGDDHLEALGGALHAALAVAEVRPRGAVDGAELHVVEGQRRTEVAAPALNQQGEETLVHLDVVRVRLTLIPEDAAQRIVLQRTDARIEEVVRRVGVTRQRAILQLDILRGTLPHPGHDEVIAPPAA